MNASAKAATNRWVPFQCPSCFGLFRLRKSQVGKHGHCPTCRSVISISGDGPAAEEKPRVTSLESNEVLLDRIAVAKQMTPEELKVQEQQHRTKRKKHFAGLAADDIDWEENAAAGSEKKTPWGVIGIGVIVLTLFGGGAAYYVKEYEPIDKVGPGGIVGDEVSQAILDNILSKDESEGYQDEEGNDLSAAAVDQFKQYDMSEVEKSVKAFLNTTTIEERIKYCRHPERVRPLMEAFYEGEEFEAEGFEALNKSEVSYRETLVTIFVQTADFLTSPIAVEQLGKGEEARYVVDWESWVGYCDMKAEEMRTRKPTTPMVMRAIMSPESYYNYGFSDDKKWRSYRIALRNSEYIFLGYAKRDSQADKAFADLRKAAQLRKGGGKAPFLIKVVYPPNGRASDQVEITEVMSSGWIIEDKDLE